MTCWKAARAWIPSAARQATTTWPAGRGWIRCMAGTGSDTASYADAELGVLVDLRTTNDLGADAESFCPGS